MDFPLPCYRRATFNSVDLVKSLQVKADAGSFADAKIAPVGTYKVQRSHRDQRRSGRTAVPGANVKSTRKKRNITRDDPENAYCILLPHLVFFLTLASFLSTLILMVHHFSKATPCNPCDMYVIVPPGEFWTHKTCDIPRGKRCIALLNLVRMPLCNWLSLPTKTLHVWYQMLASTQRYSRFSVGKVGLGILAWLPKVSYPTPVCSDSRNFTQDVSPLVSKECCRLL